MQTTQPVLCFGECLIRLSTPNKQLFNQSESLELHFAGSESNIAVALANLGIPTGLVSVLPDQALGYSFLSFLKKHGVDTGRLALQPGRMGLYFVEQGAALRSTQVIYDREQSVFAQIKPGDLHWPELLQDAAWFHLSGISAAVSLGAAQACMEAVKAAFDLNIPVSVDLNYRKNLWNYGAAPHEIMPEIVQYAQVLLADPGTANRMLNTQAPVSSLYTEAEELREAYEVILDSFPQLQYISMLFREVSSSQSNTIQGVLYHQNEFISSKRYKIEPIVERIGGGDAFMAGLIFGLLQKHELNHALETATALSALKLTIPGDVCPLSLKELQAFMEQGGSGKINR